MTFKEWLFGLVDNPWVPKHWGFLHILTLVICIILIFGFYFLVKFIKNKEKARNIIIITLGSLIAFFEVASRIVYFIKRYHLHTPDMEGLNTLWIILPKPWCAISCWMLVASIIIKKKFFYNYACLSALLCSVIFFAYPGVGFNYEHILWENFYSIVTHALLLTMSVTLLTLKFTEFKYKEFWKVAVCFVLTFAYGLLEIYVLKTNGVSIQSDPMYFMPGGDIQQSILKIPYGLYITLYCVLIIIYVNVFYLIEDRKTVKQFLKKEKI